MSYKDVSVFAVVQHPTHPQVYLWFHERWEESEVADLNQPGELAPFQVFLAVHEDVPVYFIPQAAVIVFREADASQLPTTVDIEALFQVLLEKAEPTEVSNRGVVITIPTDVSDIKTLTDLMKTL